VSIEDDREELSEFQKSLKYKLVKVGDIVKEVPWIAVEPDELLTGIVINVEKGLYEKIQWFSFSDDSITIRWFKTGQIEKLPSCYIKIISNIPSD
tara:strand:- start:428 stop:712 length:285 start_codon:yes stop_codon:yes gene_type:complete